MFLCREYHHVTLKSPVLVSLGFSCVSEASLVRWPYPVYTKSLYFQMCLLYFIKKSFYLLRVADFSWFLLNLHLYEVFCLNIFYIKSSNCLKQAECYKWSESFWKLEFFSCIRNKAFPFFFLNYCLLCQESLRLIGSISLFILLSFCCSWSRAGNFWKCILHHIKSKTGKWNLT